MVALMAFRRPVVDPGTIVPLYEQLVDDIAGQIAAGTLLPGERLPGERDLANDLGIGYQTVRRALGILAGRGLIARRQGKGTFVTTEGHGGG